MQKDNLTRDEAQARADLLGDIRYEVTLDVTTGEEAFGCEAVVRFRCSEPGTDTFLDFTAPAVDFIQLNGKTLRSDAFDGDRIHLRGLGAENEARIRGRGAYQNTGVGLHRFQDPADGEVYLYTHFEPFDAHRVYPCFDQPDLKAVFDLSVIAPAGWEVVSNGRAEDLPSPEDDAKVRWSFVTTPVMPTYITALAAGPFHTVRDRHGDIDLGLYCRRSLASHLDPAEFLDVTKRGFDFFQRAFSYPYVFGKYDQVFVPEASMGAMENAGCVTFNEKHIFRSKVTDAARELRAETVLHEMAHMWFGDLVTMRWWDDLWLNESFASFAAVLAQVSATRFSEGWTTFANSEKTWAYRQDQLPTTHPIVADIPDTRSVHLLFDGITYAKGASVLRQLVAWVGQEEFLEGMTRYFRRHEFANTDLTDFLAALEEVSGRDLHAWSKEWLQTAGVNTLRTEVTAEGADGSATLASVSVLQSAPEEWPVLRSHRVAVGIYDETADGIVRRRRAELDVVGERTDVAELAGEGMPALILLNDDDLTYAKVRLDDRSLQTVVERLGDVRSSLARTVCWTTCWDMTRDAEMRARDYLALVLRHIGKESEIGVLQRQLEQAAVAIHLYGDPGNYYPALRALAQTSRRAFEVSEAGSDKQLAWARSFISSARDGEDIDVVKGLLDGSRRFEGLDVDTELRWHAVQALAAAGIADAGVIDAELSRDRTDAGARHAALARAARPTPDAKADAWATLVEGRAIPLATLQATMAGFQRPGQAEVVEPYSRRFFEVLPGVWETRDLPVALAFARSMYPHTVVSRAVVDMTDDYLASRSVPAPIRRLLVEGRDGVVRAIRARVKDASGPSPSTPAPAS